MKEEWPHRKAPNDFIFLKKYLWNISFCICYTKNEPFENEIGIAVSFTVVLKEIKYWEIILNKERGSINTENYKTLVNEMNKNTNQWKDISHLWIGRLNLCCFNLAYYSWFL